jgi:hypothetical protein
MSECVLCFAAIDFKDDYTTIVTDHGDYILCQECEI